MKSLPSELKDFNRDELLKEEGRGGVKWWYPTTGMETLGSVHTRRSYFHAPLPIPEMPTWRKNKTSKDEILENSE